MTAPQERPVAGAGLDLDTVRKAARAAALSMGAAGWRNHRAAVLALLDALEVAEARQREMRRRLNERFTMARSVLAAEGLDHVAALVPIEEVLAWMDELEGVLRTDGGAS